MTAILRRLPFRPEADEVSFGLNRIPIKPYQIIVWVSLSAPGVLTLPPHAPRIPAILDTGNNHNFAIRADHLTEWVGVSPETLRKIGAIAVREQRYPLHAAHVWLHPNRPGHRDQFTDAPPFCARLDQGIAVYPTGSDHLPLPLLGLRALVRNHLHFWMDPEHYLVHLRTADWYTRLMRWLS